MKNMNQSKGFTLVEIMIVVVIIGLLAAMAIPAFQKVRTASQDKTVLNNARQLSAAADQYYLENGVSTVTIGNLVGTYNELAELMNLAARGLVRLMTATYPLTAVNDAMRDLDGGRVRGRGILVP